MIRMDAIVIIPQSLLIVCRKVRMESNITNICDQWLSALDVSPESLRTYTKVIRDFEAWAAQEGITDPDEADVLAYKHDLESRVNERTGQSFTTSTIQLYIGTIKRFFSWTSKKGLHPNIAEDLKTPASDRAYKKDTLTLNQVHQVLAAVSGTDEKSLRDYAIIRLMVTTGLRTAEVSNACVKDMRTLGDITVLYVRSKGRTDKSEYVEVPGELEKTIRAYLCARGRTRGQDPLFTGVGRRSRTPLRPETISRIVKSAMRAAGIDDERHTAHSLRHTAATINLTSGGSLEETRHLLRHASINTTLIYSHVIEQLGNRSASRIDAAIFANNDV